MNIPGMSALTESASFLKNAVIQYFDPIIHPQSDALVIVNLMGRCAGQSALSTVLLTTNSTTTLLSASTSFISSSAMSVRVFMAGEKKRDDPKFMSPLILNYPHLIKYASEELKDSFVFMGPLLKQHPHLIQHASKHVQESPLMRQAVLDNPALIEHAGFLQDNTEFMYPLIQARPEFIQYASERIRDIPEFMNFAISKKAELAEHASERLKGDETFMTAAIKKSAALAKYASTDLKSNPRFMQQVIKLDQSLIQLGTAELFSNPEFMLPAIQMNPAFIQYATKELKGNLAFMQSAVQMDIAHISHASKEVKGNLDFMQFVATIDPITAKEHATAELKRNAEFKQTVRDAEFMQVALEDPRLVDHCDERFKNNEGFMLRLIAKNPDKFPLASEELRKSLEFVIKALKANPHILHHIDEKFKSNEELMKFVVKKNPSIRSLVIPIIVKHPALTQFIAKELLDDPTMMKPLVDRFPETIQWAFPTLVDIISKGSQSELNAVTTSAEPNRNMAIQLIKVALSPIVLNAPQSPYLRGNNLEGIYDLVKFIEATAEKNPVIIQYLPTCFLENSMLILSIASLNPDALEYLPKEAVNNPEISQMLAMANTKQYLSLPTVSEDDRRKLAKDRLTAAEMVKENIDNLNFISEENLNNITFMRQIVKKHPEALKRVGQSVLEDEPLMLDLAGTYPLELLQLTNLPQEWFDHFKFMDKILAQKPVAINRLGPFLKDQLMADVFSLTKEGDKNPQWMDFRKEEHQALLAQASVSLLIELASRDYHILEYVPLYFLSDSHNMLPVALANPTALKYIGVEIEGNKEFFDTLYQKHGAKVYSYASEKLKEEAKLGLARALVKTPERRRRN